MRTNNAKNRKEADTDGKKDIFYFRLHFAQATLLINELIVVASPKQLGKPYLGQRG